MPYWFAASTRRHRPRSASSISTGPLSTASRSTIASWTVSNANSTPCGSESRMLSPPTAFPPDQGASAIGAAFVRSVPPSPESGEYAPDELGVGDPTDPLDQRRAAHIDAFRIGDLENIVERPGHDLAEPTHDLVLRPEVLLDVLDPLEVTDRHSPGVGEDVGNYEDASLAQDLVGIEVGRVVGPFDDDLGLDVRGVFLGYHPLEGSWDQQVAWKPEEVGPIDVIGVRIPLEVTLLVHPFADVRHVETIGVVDGARDVRHGHHPTAHLGRRHGRIPAHVPEPVDRHSGSRHVHAHVMCRLWQQEHEAPAGSFAPGNAAAESGWLAGDYGR